jgi:hypothetical protein
VRGGDVPDGDLDVVGLGRFGEQIALQLLGEGPQLPVEADVVEGGRRATTDLGRGRQLVRIERSRAGARQRERTESPVAEGQRQDRGGPRCQPAAELRDRARILGRPERTRGGLGPEVGEHPG